MLGLLARSMEQVLNRNLQASVGARQLAEQLEARSMDVGVLGAEPLLRLRVTEGVLSLGHPDQNPADVSLAGDWLRLMDLLTGDKDSPGLELRGDPAVAKDFAQLLKYCHLDPEEELARLTGDGLARQVGDMGLAAARWGLGVAGSLQRNTRDFVQEERRASPTRVEFDAFVSAVHALLKRTQRLERRMRKLSAARGD